MGVSQDRGGGGVSQEDFPASVFQICCGISPAIFFSVAADFGGGGGIAIAGPFSFQSTQDFWDGCGMPLVQQSPPPLGLQQQIKML